MKWKGAPAGFRELGIADVATLTVFRFSPVCTNRPNLFCNTLMSLGAESLWFRNSVNKESHIVISFK